MLYWNLKKKSARKFINDHLINSQEPDHKLAGAIALGVFFGIMPIWGYQWAGALFLAHLLKLNKLITYTFTNISIPPMIPFILYGSVKMGELVLGNPVDIASISDINFTIVKAHLFQYLLGSLMLGTLVAIVVGAASFLLL